MNRENTAQKRRPIIWKTGVIGVLVTALTAGLLSACMPGYDVPADFPCPQENLKGTYNLNLTVTAGSFVARSGGHEDTSYKDPAESFINVVGNDYAVFLFGENGAFLQRVEPGSVSLKQGSGSSPVYEITGTFKSEEDLTNVQVMVLANWRTSFGGSYNGFEDAIAGMKLSKDSSAEDNVYTAEKEAFNFKMPSSASDGTAPWKPSNGISGIPMFGLAEVTLNGNDVNTSNTIPMLRSLVKIEIVDMVPNGSANIERCVLTSYNKNGRFIPDATLNPDWNKDKTQVITPSLPQSVTTGSNLQFETTKRKVTIDGSLIEKDCFVVYIPEMLMEENLQAVDRPELKVYLENIEEPYTIYLCNYKEGKPTATGYTSLLRNHIYRYNVCSVGIETKLTLYIETPDWNLDDDQFWIYEDLKPGWSEDGKFEWIDPIWENFTIMDDNYERILLVTKDIGAVGTFTLNSPADTKWILSLVTDDGTLNHWFRIDLWDEEKQTWIVADQIPDADKFIADTQTGDINGKPVKFRIMPTGTNSSESDYAARVVLTLQTFDGRVLNVDLRGNSSATNPNEDNYYYKVKQLTNGGDNM